MILYLLRHGIAEEVSPGGRDEERELTDDGRAKLNDLLRRAAKAGVKPRVILSSPYQRAMQTAKLAAKLLGGPEPVEAKVLTPHGDPRAVWDAVRGYSDTSELLLAGHEPLLSSTVSHLLASPALQLDMKKGTMVAIQFESLRREPHGVLRWILTPRLCV